MSLAWKLRLLNLSILTFATAPPIRVALENEVCPVFAARTTSALQINDDEVMDYQWCDLADVLHGIDATPWAFSPWMVMQATNREARKRLSAFTQLK